MNEESETADKGGAGKGDAAEKQRVVILGGGMGSLAAAWYLSDSEDLRSQYDVTVYQLGWRLGGKGASGRNGRTGMGSRIEEHGIHYFFGFYENAFHLMRKCSQDMIDEGLRQASDPLATCFGENGTDPIFRKIEKEGESSSKLNATIMEKFLGAWKRWEMTFPNTSGLPGGRVDTSGQTPENCAERWDLTRSGMDWLRNFHFEFIEVTGGAAGRNGAGEAIGGMRISRFLGEGITDSYDGVYQSLNDYGLPLGRGRGDGRKAFNKVLEALNIPDDIHFLDLLQKLAEEPERPDYLGPNEVIVWDSLREWSLWQYGIALEEHLEQLEESLGGGQSEAFRQASWIANFGGLGILDWIRRAILLGRFMAAFALALLRDKVRRKGFDSIESWEFTEWIEKRGLTSREVATFPVVRALYAMGYGYNPKKIKQWSMGAGTISRIILRMFFDYRGSLAWRMQAGMGDAIFAPLYQALKHRGVKFRFFHRVDSLKLVEKDGKKQVGEIVLKRQVKMADGSGDTASYQPLVDVKGLPCWPSEPNYDQLDEDQADMLKDLKENSNLDLESMWIPWANEEEEVTLKVRGTDSTETKGKDGDAGVFDSVVLGISVGAFKTICKDLMLDSKAWKKMVQKLETIETSSVQLWMKKKPRDIGWKGSLRPMVMSYLRPFDTWHDFSHLIKRECLDEKEVKQIGYFMDVLKDSDPPPMFFEKGYDEKKDSQYPKEQRERVLSIFRDQFLKKSSKALWPKAHGFGGFKWHWLYDSQNRKGEDRVDWQYFRLNSNPSDRYVLWRPGTLDFRMRPDESGYGNLFLAGDWTRNGLNAGSVEAACMSGMQASRAICRHPLNVYGEGI